jgi:hypothetical protein
MEKETPEFSCKKVTELVEKKRIEGISPYENLQVNLHFLVCKACYRYQQQSDLLEVLFAGIGKKAKQLPPVSENDIAVFKQKLLEGG